MQIARKVNYWLIVLVLIAVPIQFLVVGQGIYGGDYEPHIIFGNLVLHLATLLIVIAGGVGRLGWRQFWFALVLFLGGFVQIMMVEIGKNADVTWLSGLHPMLAFLVWPYVYLLLLPTARAAVSSPPPAAV